MKIVLKSDLEFVAGYLVDKNGLVHNTPQLVDDVNTLFQLDGLMRFVEANKDDILAAGADRPVYEAPNFETPEFEYDHEVETPLLDEHRELETKRAEEFLAVQVDEDIKHMLGRYPALAEFVKSDVVKSAHTLIDPPRFLTDPLAITEEWVIDVATRYQDRDMRQLISKVDVRY